MFTVYTQVLTWSSRDYDHLKECHIVQSIILVQYIVGIVLSKLDEPEMEIFFTHPSMKYKSPWLEMEYKDSMLEVFRVPMVNNTAGLSLQWKR